QPDRSVTRWDLDGTREIAVSAHGDLDRPFPDAVRVEPESNQARAHLRSGVGPSRREWLDARDESRRGHGLRCQDEDRLAIRPFARDLLVVAGGTGRHAEREGRHESQCTGPGPPHRTTRQFAATRAITTRAVTHAPNERLTRRALHRWIPTGSRSGASARNRRGRSRPSRFDAIRSWVGVATPRVAANASAISSSVKKRRATRYTRSASLPSARTSIMFARSTAWRHGEGRTCTKKTSMSSTLPSRTMRFAGLMSRCAIP